MKFYVNSLISNKQKINGKKQYNLNKERESVIAINSNPILIRRESVATGGCEWEHMESTLLPVSWCDS